MSNRKLTPEDKVKIALSSDKSLRELAQEYRVHHSTIDAIRKEAKGLIEEKFSSKKAGRPVEEKVVTQSEYDKLQVEYLQMRDKWAIATMTGDFQRIRNKYDRIYIDILKEEMSEVAEKKADSRMRTIKKKEKIETLSELKNHDSLFSLIDYGSRIECGGFTYKQIDQMNKYVQESNERGSRLHPHDVKAAVETIVEYPMIGGEKGRMTMLDQETGCIGSTSYKEIKETLRGLASDTYKERQTKSQLEINLKDRKSKDNEISEPLRAKHPHDIWAIDFTELKTFGVRIYGCVVYDLFSQGYVSFELSLNADADAAWKAIETANKQYNIWPNRLLSDNGSHFIASEFTGKLKTKHITTPPGKPWLNGALETGNKDLKNTFYTILSYMAAEKIRISSKGTSVKDILSFAKGVALKTIDSINNKIVRAKFKTPPKAVFEDKVQQSLERQIHFRDERIKANQEFLQSKKNEGQKLKTLQQKIKSAWSYVAKTMSDDKLYAFKELICGRVHAVK